MIVDLDKPISVQITRTISAIRLNSVTIRPSEETGFVQVNYSILDNEGNEIEVDTLWLQPEIMTKEIVLTKEELQEAKAESSQDILKSSVVQKKIDQISKDPDCYGIVDVQLYVPPPLGSQNNQSVSVLIRCRTGDFFKLALVKCKNKTLHECLIGTLVNYIKERLLQKFSQS